MEENPHPKPRRRGHREVAEDTIPEESNQVEEDEEDEVDDESEEEEADDKFDIDVTSPNPAEAKVVINSTLPQEEIRAMNKTDELLAAKKTFDGEVKLTQALQSAGLSSQTSSKEGVESPERYANGQCAPHPPAVSPRHIGLGMHMTKMLPTDMPRLELGQPGLDIDGNPPAYEASQNAHSPSIPSILKTSVGEKDEETTTGGDRLNSPDVRTPRARLTQPHFHNSLPVPGERDRPTRQRARTLNGRNWRSRSHDAGRSQGSGRQRAFAAWGYDESEASDSDNT